MFILTFLIINCCCVCWAGFHCSPNEVSHPRCWRHWSKNGVLEGDYGEKELTFLYYFHFLQFFCSWQAAITKFWSSSVAIVVFVAVRTLLCLFLLLYNMRWSNFPTLLLIRCRTWLFCWWWPRKNYWLFLCFILVLIYCLYFETSRHFWFVVGVGGLLFATSRFKSICSLFCYSLIKLLSVGLLQMDRKLCSYGGKLQNLVVWDLVL